MKCCPRLKCQGCCFGKQSAQDLRKRITAKLFSPHIILVVTCICYLIVGAWMLQWLEGGPMQQAKDRELAQIHMDSNLYTQEVWDLANKYKDELTSTNKAELVKKIRGLAKPKFSKYVDDVFAAYRHFRHGFEDDSPAWDFLNAFVFTSTTLTSIGFGFVCPITFWGRAFLLGYCLIGIPLTLVTVANIAKFISESVFHVHYYLWTLWMRFKNRNSREPPTTEEDEIKKLFSDAEDEQEILDRVRLIRFPPIVVFMFAIVYGFFAAALITQWEEWTYLESLYFTFIAILTVGFGDFRPAPNNMLTVLVVILGGVTLTTMCMDVVGRMYLKEIHYLGRKLQTNNPFYLIREAKARRRRAAMASLLAQLARGMIFAHRNYSELARKRSSRRKHKKRESHILPDGKFMFARLPPDPPRECQVVSTSAYSVRLRWEPAFSTDSDVTYNIRYRLKYIKKPEDNKVRELIGITGNSVEIMAIQSCSLYEFRVTAVSRYGEGKPVILVQYTEPQLSPQHILAKKLNANTIELNWEPPYKRTRQVKEYTVYYTDNPAARLCDWQKLTVNGRSVVFPELQYDWFYMFCANAIFKDGQRSPLSRALFIKTDKLEFNSCYVGHSRTIEVMEAISEHTEPSEATPLLRRNFMSFQA
uniref:Fibronectin type-III domain-containing protein n=1 Tax=Panagrellus redivivus TaxID=6233 RepID=A0A7E4V6C2_PANRE